MKENSEIFNRAFGRLQSSLYKEAEILFKQCLVDEPDNFAAHNNIGVCLTYLGIEKRNLDLLESAIKHLKIAIELVERIPGESYPSAEGNLKWAIEELDKLKNKIN